MTGAQSNVVRGLAGLFRLEVRRSIGLLAFVPLAGLALWVARGELPQRIWLWNETSYALQASVIILGPVVAGIAAWAAGRDQRRGMGDLLATIPTSRSLQSLVTCLGTVVWGVTAYLVAVLALSALTAFYATWGAPVLGPMLIGLLVILMYGASGFAAGFWMPSRFTAPLVAIVLFGAQVVVADWASYEIQQFSPYRLGTRFEGDVFYDVQPTLTLPYTVWALGVTAVALVVLMLKSRRTTAVWVSLVLASVMTVGGASALVTRAQLLPDRIAVAYEPVCDASWFTVCVHPAYEPLLPEAAGLIRDIVEPVADLPGVPERAEQRSLGYPQRDESQRNTDELRFELENIAYHDPGKHVLARDVAWRLVGAPDDPMQAKLQAIVADWLMYQAGVELREETDAGNFVVWGWTSPSPNSPERQALERLIEIPDHQGQAWLEAHWTKLRAGELTLEDLP